MKYKRIFWVLVTTLIKKPMVKHLGKEFTIKTIQKAKPIYKSMLSEVTDIGSNNPMAANIYMGFVFMALYQVAAEKCDTIRFTK